MKRFFSARIWAVLISLGCLLIALVLQLFSLHLQSKTPPDTACRLWGQSSEYPYSQISVFMKDGVSLDSLRSFGAGIENAYTQASYKSDTGRLWCCSACSNENRVTIAKEEFGSSTSVSCTTVYGDFFEMHPFRFINGWYFSDDDLNFDSVIIDRELAWRLFGGYELQGMSIYLNGYPCVICGVLETPSAPYDNFFSVSEPHIYISSVLSEKLIGEPVFTSYDAILPNPVSKFALDRVTENFPVSSPDAIITESSARFSFSSLWQKIRNFSKSSAQTAAIALPWWENGARMTDSRCALILFIQLLLLLFPLGTAVYFFTLLILRRKELFNALLCKLKIKKS